ncbi:flagellar biosynthesis anti-sigma factor FlgM [Desulfohalobiaceae bacterium Ax17]|jgi:negative regulator of flagellin synthesis FlgM|uniref:flagellar biosynthesis anti-sigma factor FlgM n=1 Tax=Desulfovulcanus ferrireducens TaxID=2831190 RepID=UPI00207BB324|nr:flagellar biosynthesis anti-sigma factor FlgM [Desulfovulcanus ferrireducens]MBT8763794.1 flagellar biosynthesis anti-sigma factor FlgM [Desulfovulcanus ferrireducens]
MEIKNILTGIQTYKQTKIEKEEKPLSKKQHSISTEDKVSLSSTAKLYKTGLDTAKQSPEVRLEKIQELKEKIEAGDYHPDEQKIAQKILEDEMDLWI